MKKFPFLFLILNFFLIKSICAMDWVDSSPEDLDELYAQITQQAPLNFEDIPFKEGHQFHGKRISLNCTEASYTPQLETAVRNFSICLREGSEKQIGKLQTVYYPRQKDMHISWIEILDPHKGQGYAGEVVQALLDAYKLPLLKDVDFDSFSGTVLLGDNKFASSVIKTATKLKAEATEVSDKSIHYKIKRTK